MTRKILSKKPEETLALGRRIAAGLKPGDIVCLLGQLGSGKTVLTKGIAKGLGLKDSMVSSPTFTFLNIYEGKTNLYHFDLYRIEKLRELEGLGMEEFLYGQGICVIEWAERLGSFLPENYLEVKIHHKNETTRELVLSTKGTCSDHLLMAETK